MTKFLAGLTVTAVAAGAILIVGCSSSDKLAGSHLPAGDPDSQDYQQFSQVADGLNASGGDMINGMFEQCGMIVQMGSSAPRGKEGNPFAARFASAVTDSFSAYYNSDTKYWHAYWSYTDAEKGATAVFQDSIQFIDGMTAVQWPDTLTITEVRCGQAVNISYENQSGSLTITATSHWTVTGAPGAIPSGGRITINGGVDHQVEASGLASGCSTSLALTGAYNSVETTLPSLQASETCPLEGTIHLHGTANSTCESDSATVSIDGTWDWFAAFDDGSVAITANNGHFEWTFNGSCGGSVSVSKK